MIAADQHAVAEEAEVSVGMTRQLEHLPAVDLAALVEQHRVDRVTDEGRKRVALDDQIFRDRRGRPVPDEPGGHPLRPILAPPYPLALRVVETSLVDRGAGDSGGGFGATDVIRMEMGDRDAPDLRFGPGRVSEPEAGVEERPVRDVAVDVLRAGRERQGQAPNTVFEPHERLFYTACTGHWDRVFRKDL